MNLETAPLQCGYQGGCRRYVVREALKLFEQVGNRILEFLDVVPRRDLGTC